MDILEQTALVERLAPGARTARHLPLVFFKLVQRHAANAGVDTSKGNIDQLGVEAHRLK